MRNGDAGPLRALRASAMPGPAGDAAASRRVELGKPWFVVNPNAGRVRYGALETAIRRALAGRDATIASEPPPVGSPPRMVVAVGGDGTINRVINRCDPSLLRIGLIPRGTANDLASELAIPADFRGAWGVLEKRRFERIDVLAVNGLRFVTCGGLGLASDVAARTNAWKSRGGWRGRVARSMGHVVYVLATLNELRRGLPRTIDATIRFDGVSRDVRLSTAFVSNQSRLGGGFSPSPQASNRDGELHLCGIGAPGSRAHLVRHCLHVYRGTVGRCPDVFQLRAPSLEVETAEEVTFFGDGELLARGRRFHLEVLPRALEVAAPGPPLAPDETTGA